MDNIIHWKVYYSILYTCTYTRYTIYIYIYNTIQYIVHILYRLYTCVINLPVSEVLAQYVRCMVPALRGGEVYVRAPKRGWKQQWGGKKSFNHPPMSVPAGPAMCHSSREDRRYKLGRRCRTTADGISFYSPLPRHDETTRGWRWRTRRARCNADGLIDLATCMHIAIFRFAIAPPPPPSHRYRPPTIICSMHV